MAEGFTWLSRAAGVRVSPRTYPEYMPKGEVHFEDQDGHTLIFGQAR
jgi:hypothetical protein